MLFQNRVEAGQLLSQRLRQFRNGDCVVMSIPRGGVVVGYEIAKAIGAPLDVVVARKLGAPGEPELAIGAVVTWGNGRKLDQAAVGYLGVTPAYIESETQAQIQEVQRRLMAYRGSVEPPDLIDKTALLVDDGIATGYTVLAAVDGVRSLNPAAVVVAAPVASVEAAHRISVEADEFVCLVTPSPFLAVGNWYADFGQVTDEEVVELLRRRDAELKAAASGKKAEG